jgi:hypothetical protein
MHSGVLISEAIPVETQSVHPELNDIQVIRCRITHQSVIKTTFVLYFAMLAGIRSASNAMGPVSIIGRWKPFV